MTSDVTPTNAGYQNALVNARQEKEISQRYLEQLREEREKNGDLEDKLRAERNLTTCNWEAWRAECARRKRDRARFGRIISNRTTIGVIGWALLVLTCVHEVLQYATP